MGFWAPYGSPGRGAEGLAFVRKFMLDCAAETLAKLTERDPPPEGTINAQSCRNFSPNAFCCDGAGIALSARLLLVASGAGSDQIKIVFFGWSPREYALEQLSLVSTPTASSMRPKAEVD